MLRRAVCLVVAVLTSAAAAAVGRGETGVPVPGTPPCYGAAARDRAHPCTNPALSTQVTPAPADALLVPDAPCTPIVRRRPPAVCEFGAPPTAARATVALLGDSHASAWRAALGVAAGQMGWRGLSLTKSSCPFSRARPRIGPADRAACRRWNTDVVAWFSVHPHVHDVFVSAHVGAPVLRDPGRTGFASKVAGFTAAWAALPVSVRRIFVLRDVPTRPGRTTTCIDAAIAARRPSTPGCAVRRAGALLGDAEAVAARRLGSPRVRVIDLTPFMCGRRSCYPVVGGVLVNKDTNHLSREFSTTLGPYVLRALPSLTSRTRSR